MSNATQTSENKRSPRLLPLLVITVLLTMFVLSLNYVLLAPGKLLNIAMKLHEVLRLDELSEKISPVLLTRILSILLQLLYLRIGFVIRTKVASPHGSSGSFMKNKLYAGATFLVWGWFFLWCMLLCDPTAAEVQWLGEAAEIGRELLGVSAISESILTKAKYVTLWGSALGDVIGIYLIISDLIDDFRADKTEKQEKKTKTDTAQKESTKQKKDAPREKEKPKAQPKPRSGVSAMDTYAASAADERLKKYMNSMVPTELVPCIRVKLLSTSDAMENEVIRPFREDGSLFISLDCGSFTYELAFRLDENGHAYLLGNEDEPLSPDAPHAACSKIDGKSVPQIFIEYIKV